MIATWYAVVSFMLIIYIVLDGRNFGAGMLHWFVAKTPEQRRQVIAAIGPLWTWHEVWLLGFGGTLLAIFPRLMASAFAGYYLALFLILWCLICAESPSRSAATSMTGFGRDTGTSISSFRIFFSPFFSARPQATSHAEFR